MRKCTNPPAVRYTWPGNVESFACIEHAIGIARISQAMGFYLQMIPLTVEEMDQTCSQNVEDDEVEHIE